MSSFRPASRIWSLGLVSALAMASCDAGPEPRTEPAPQASASGRQQAESASPAADCPPTAQYTSRDLQGTGAGATLWAMLFATQVRAGTEVKVAWRMTGSGDLSIRATGPDGTVVQPVLGPDPHGGSNWDRPGDEWGTRWVFPSPGCWTIDATRTSGTGSLVLRVGR
ncbi:hypothetical protein [Micromonospora haikouensis]|uniref:hypothetical protein n=1 Tax=Micromonospora haikouensis TaxID=686309 RepID=UPI003D741469